MLLRQWYSHILAQCMPCKSGGDCAHTKVARCAASAATLGLLCIAAEASFRAISVSDGASIATAVTATGCWLLPFLSTAAGNVSFFLRLHLAMSGPLIGLHGSVLGILPGNVSNNGGCCLKDEAMPIPIIQLVRAVQLKHPVTREITHTHQHKGSFVNRER